MFRPLTTHSTRRGNTLIVTLACLSLLAVVGLTAVSITGDQANRSHLQSKGLPDDEFGDRGMSAFNAYMSGFIYDRADSGQDLLAADRGHSLVATMYSRQIGSTIAFNGIGSFGATGETVTVNGEPAFPRVFVLNHRVFPSAAPPGNWFDPEWSQTRPGGTAVGSGPGQQYIPKNAPYTYADLNNLFLASICPATGEVLVPSYLRPNTPGSFGSLDPTNPNWNNASGAVQTPRPTQGRNVGTGFNPNFPLVAQNADGTYTGDVRNRPGGYVFNQATGQYVARNDSIWIDIGLPAFTYKGRRLKALVAPLVVDLNGFLSLNDHGNAMAAGGSHASGQGLLRSEVSLQKVLGAEGQAIVSARGNVASPTPPAYQTRGGLAQRAFDPRLPAGQQLPSYSAVAWSGGGGANPATSLLLPGAGTNSLFATTPAYDPAAYASTNATVPSHPSLYIPREWNSTPSPLRTFNDTKLLQSMHAGTPGFYAAMEAGAVAQRTLRGGPHAVAPTYGSPFPNPPQQATINGHRTDPAHPNRGIFATQSAQLDSLGLTPTSANLTAGLTRAANAGIGGVDINRPLADYRNLAAAPNVDAGGNPTPQPLGPSNMGNEAAARLDRQYFAMDIFARLIVATEPALATVNPTTGVVTIAADPVANAAEYNVLRNLAQLAANMVDFRDGDDVSTPFVWNPLVQTDPQNAANYAATELSNRIVFGVEKPRLVLNEVHSEVVNDPNDPAFTNNMTPASNPAHIRFWLEFQNPTNTTGGAVGTGAVKVRYTAATDGVSFSPYLVQIVRSSQIPGGAGANLLRDPAHPNNPGNVTGGLNGATPDVVFDFSAADAQANADVLYTVNPANATNAVPNAVGSVLVCAANVPMTRGPEFNPGNFGGFVNLIQAAATPNAIGGSTSALSYPLPLATAFPAGNTPDANLARHVVLLRRLANPYLPPDPVNNTNPYITIDFVDYARSADRVLLANNTTTNNQRTAKTPANMTGYDPNTAPAAAGDPDLRPKAIGKVQPYVAWTDTAATYAFPASMVVLQNPTPDPMHGVMHTFTRYNGRDAATPPAAATYALGPPATITDTIMAPFDWLPHLDRTLINQVELLHVSTGKPHELTQQFIIPDGAGGVRKHTSSLFDGTPTSQLLTTRMYRVLELLRIRGHGEGDSLHGRKAGLINLNTIQDKRIWDSLFDVQSGNGFTQAQVDAMWNALIASRTVNMQARHGVTGTQLTDTAGVAYNTPIPGATIYDMNMAADPVSGARYDRPFLPLGVSQHAAPGGSALPGGGTVFAGGQGIDDTILRRINQTTGAIDPTLLPTIFQNAGLHPYQQVEAARKILNNTTTHSNVFAVWVTVGYFEVEAEFDSTIALPTGGFAQFTRLGNEFYRAVPADTRFKFWAIVDRSMVAMEPTSYQNYIANPAANPAPTQVAQPFFTSVEQNANLGTSQLVVATDAAGQVYSDGVPVAIPAGALVVGVGANQEIVTVLTVTVGTDPVTGRTISTLTLAAPLTKNHYAGESFSNGISGNPGPQTNFDVNSAMYRFVVPQWSRVP